MNKDITFFSAVNVCTFFTIRESEPNKYFQIPAFVLLYFGFNAGTYDSEGTTRLKKKSMCECIVSINGK